MEESKTPITNTIRRALSEGEKIQRVRATIRPLTVGFYYPTPWRVAEVNGRGMHVIACAEGHYAAECPTLEAAEAIVLAVNAFAGAAR